MPAPGLFVAALVFGAASGLRRASTQMGSIHVVEGPDQWGKWIANASRGLFRNGKDFDLSLPGRKTKHFSGAARIAAKAGNVLAAHKWDGSAEVTAVMEKSGAIAGSIVDPDDGMVHQFVGEEGGELVFHSTPSDDYPEAKFDMLPAPEPEDAEVESDSLASGVETQDDGSVLDVMVLWTRDAECRNAGLQRGCDPTDLTEDRIRAKIDLAVEETNAGYRASLINASLRLVHAYRETSYAEKRSGSGYDVFNDALRGLWSKHDGKLDDIHVKRAAYGADLVVMVVDEPRLCGLAYPGPRKDLMVSVVQHSCATGYYSFGHEIGHNLGCQHDTGTNKACDGTKGLMHGFRAPDASFRTIMAYSCRVGQCDGVRKRGCTRMNFYSNPRVSFRGQPTGITGAADNAQQINNVVTEVARYFPTKIPVLAAVPATASTS